MHAVNRHCYCAREKDSLTDYLKGVYADRFGLPIEIRVMYKEPKESTLKYNDMRLQQEVDSILDQVEAVQKQKEEKSRKKKQSLGKKKHLEADKVEKIPETEKFWQSCKSWIFKRQWIPEGWLS